MTPKTQSVCKHCQKEIVRASFGWATAFSGDVLCFTEMSRNPRQGGHEPAAEPAFYRSASLQESIAQDEVERVARPSGPSAPLYSEQELKDQGLQATTVNYGKEGSATMYSPAPQTSAGPGFTKGYKYHGYADEPVSDACGDGKHSECTFDLTKCHCKHRAGHNTMHSYANPTVPAPQSVSGDAPDMNDPRYCGACKHVHPPHEVDCRCYCDKVSCPECGPRIAARVMAGDAPKVEELKADTLFGVYCSGNTESVPKDRAIYWEGWQRVADYVNRVRRYFPPASQTPKWRCFHCFFETSDYAKAEAHFGDGEGDAAICVYWANLSAEDRLKEFQYLTEQLNAERDEGGILLARAEKAEKELEKLATPASTARTDAPKKCECGHKWHGDDPCQWIGKEEDMELRCECSESYIVLYSVDFAAPGSVPQAQGCSCEPGNHANATECHNLGAKSCVGVPQAEPPKEEQL